MAESAAATTTATATAAASPLLYDFTLVSPWFEYAREGKKRFEGRLQRKPAALLHNGDMMRITHAQQPATLSPFYLCVKAVDRFESFEAGLRSETVGLAAALPGVNSIDEGVRVYQQFYSIEEQANHGVLFIEVERVEAAVVKGIPRAVRKISLWMQPQPASELDIKLTDAIRTLSTRHNQLPFTPHITLATFQWPVASPVTLADMTDAIHVAWASLGDVSRSLHVRCQQLATHPTNPFMTLVIMLERDAALMKLRESVWQHVLEPIRRSLREEGAIDEEAWPQPFPFVPHISLLYDVPGQLSPLKREQILEQDCEWDGQHGRTAFGGLEFDIGCIDIVATDTQDYANEWHSLVRVPLPTGREPIQISSRPPAAIPPSPDMDWNAYKNYVEQQKHEPFLRLTLEHALQSREQTGNVVAMCGGAALVCDALVVWSGGSNVEASGDCTAHAPMLLLRSLQASSAPTVRFFTSDRLRRMQLYLANEACEMCAAALECSDIRACIYAIDRERMQKLLSLRTAEKTTSLIIGPMEEAMSLTSAIRMLMSPPSHESTATSSPMEPHTS